MRINMSKLLLMLVFSVTAFTGCKADVNAKKKSKQVANNFSIDVKDTPPPYTKQEEISFSASAVPGITKDSSVDFFCSINGSDAKECTSPLDLTTLEDGQHLLKIQAKAAAKTVEKSLVFLLDRVRPTLNVQHNISPIMSQNIASFQINATDDNSGIDYVKCKLDNNPESFCSTSVVFSNLAAGAHEFRAWANDKAGNHSIDFVARWSVRANSVTCSELVATNPAVGCGPGFSGGTKFTTTSITCPNGPYGAPSLNTSSFNMSSCSACLPTADSTFTPVCAQGANPVANSGKRRTIFSCTTGVAVPSTVITNPGTCTSSGVSCTPSNQNNALLACGPGYNGGTKFTKTITTCPEGAYGRPNRVTTDFDMSGCISCPAKSTTPFTPTCDANKTPVPNSGTKTTTFNCSSGVAVATTTTSIPGTCKDTAPTCLAGPVANTPVSCGPIPTLAENANASILPNGTFTGINENEIFQRKDNNNASIAIKLNANVLETTKYYSISVLSNSNVKESTLSSGPFNRETNYNVELSTGMNAKKIRFSFFNVNGQEISRWISPPFSVGEVFLVAGQSNSSNHGKYEGTSKSPLNRAVNPVDKSWVVIKDPLPYGSNYSMSPWDNPTEPSGSPWPSFADDLSAELQVPVAVISVGWGGSGANMWLVGSASNYFSRLVLGANSVPNCGFRAVLWHQGESESIGKIPANEYQSTLESMVSSFRSTTGCQKPWMIARVSYLDYSYWMNQYKFSKEAAIMTKWQSETAIRKAQTNLSAKAGFLLGPDTDLLVADIYRHDKLHFNQAGLAIHGKLWSQRILGMLGRNFKTEEELIPEVKTVWNLYKTILNRSDADIKKDPEGVRYWVDNLSGARVTAADIEASFKASDEAFLRKTFIEVLGRAPTWEEVVKWVAELGAGRVSRDKLSEEIVK